MSSVTVGSGVFKMTEGTRTGWTSPLLMMMEGRSSVLWVSEEGGIVSGHASEVELLATRWALGDLVATSFVEATMSMKRI